MITAFIEGVLIILVTVTGFASQYAPGKMESVIWVRQNRPVSKPLTPDLPPVDGYIAVLDCDEIGEVWWLRPDLPGWAWDDWESFLVVDCAGSIQTRDWMLRNNILIEVDYNTAARWNTVGRGIRIEKLEGFVIQQSYPMDRWERHEERIYIP